MKLIFFIICLSGFLQSLAQEQPLLGQQAPAFQLKSLNGKNYSLEQFKGKYVVIHFATTWCPFCNAEAPYLEQLYKNYRDKNVQVLLIDVKENKELIEKVFSKYNFTFPVLLDEDGSTSARYAPEGVLPDLARDEVPLASNIILDRDGKFRFYSLLNSRNFDAKLIHLQETLDQLLTIGK